MFQVLQPRALVEIVAIVSRGLLLKEPQWVGILIKPLDYSLKGAVLHVTAKSGLQLDPNQTAQLEPYRSVLTTNITEVSGWTKNPEIEERSTSIVDENRQFIEIKNGKLELVDWASSVESVLWVRVAANSDSDETSSPPSNQPSSLSTPSRKSLVSRTPSLGPSPLGLKRTVSSGLTGKEPEASVDASADGLENGTSGQEQSGMLGGMSRRVGMRTLNVKLEFGASRSRVYERYVHFSLPVAENCSVIG